MDAFHTPICSLQGGSNYQRMQHNYVLPGIQPSHQSHSLRQNVSQNTPLIAPNSYQLSNINGNNQVALAGLSGPVNGPVNILPSLNPSSNFMPFVVNNTNSITYNCNGGLFPTVNSQASPVNVIAQDQTSKIQNLKIDSGISSDKSSEVANDKIENFNSQARKGDNNNGRKTKDANASNATVDAREKIGYINMDVTPIIPMHNIPVSSILDLNFMGCLFEIKNLSVNLHTKVTYKSKFLDVLKQIIGNKTLLYWYILKCEEKEIPVFQLNVCAELYSVDNFQTLYETIDEESCLPLPLISRGLGNKKKYFYINLAKGNNDKVMKLNAAVFFDVEQEKKLKCQYPGIKLHCNFSECVKDFTIHIHESAMAAYQSCSVYIRELITYKHVIWGFLQAWIRGVVKRYKDFFSAEQISKNLSLQQMEVQNGKVLSKNEKGSIYPIGYSNFYLKFDPANSKQVRYSFSVENFETKFVCDATIIQYYRQFFHLNDKNLLGLLNYVVLFVAKKSARANIQNDQNSSRSKSLPKGEKPPVVSFAPEKIHIASSQGQGSTIEIPQSSSEASISDIRINKERSGMLFGLGTFERAENSVGNQDIGNSTDPNEQTAVCTSEMLLARPLLKTRTVEEINSSIEANKRLGFYPINFDTVGKLDVANDAGTQSKQQEFATVIQEVLKNSYSTNSSEITKLDEVNDDDDDDDVIRERFSEALDRAMDSKSLEAFIGTIYVNLQLHFTNSTSQKILNSKIEKAIEKYPDLKNLYPDSESTVQTFMDKPSTEHHSWLLEMLKQTLATENGCLDLNGKTAMESGSSSKEGNLQNPQPETRSMDVEIFVSKPLENAQPNSNSIEIISEDAVPDSRSDVLSEDEQPDNRSDILSEVVDLDAETCPVAEDEKVEGAKPSHLEEDDLASSKNDHSITLDENVELKCKTEMSDSLTDVGSAENATGEGPTSAKPEAATSSDAAPTELECKPKLDAQASPLTSQTDSKHRPVKLNDHDIRNFNRNCGEEENGIQNKTNFLDSLQLSCESKKRVIFETDCEPGKKKRKRNDSDGENNEIRARALERLRKRSEVLKDWRVTNIVKRNKNETEILRNSKRKCGDGDDTKENDFGGNRFKKEVKILLKRLEDTPEYKKYIKNSRPNLRVKGEVGAESSGGVATKKLARRFSPLKRKKAHK